MGSVRLKPGLRFKLNGSIYRIAAMLADGNVRAVGETFNEEIIYTQNSLIKELNAGNLVFEICDRSIKSTNHEVNFKPFIDDSEYEKYSDEAKFKFKVIEPFVNKENKCITKKDVAKRTNEINTLENDKSKLFNLLGCTYFKKVSVATIYRWIKQFIESNRDIRALVPRYINCGGRGKHRLDSYVDVVTQEEIDNYFLLPTRPSVVDLWGKVCEKIDDFNKFSEKKIGKPSYETITRYVNSIPEYELWQKRYGKREQQIANLEWLVEVFVLNVHLKGLKSMVHH